MLGLEGVRPRWRLLLDLLLLGGVYFLVPLGGDSTDPVLWLRLVVVVVAFPVVGVSIARRVVTQTRRESAARGVETMLVLVVSGVLFSAAADYVIAVAAPGQFAGLDTRVDALYFALVTLTTIGYGDIHPVGQVARAVVIAQMIFNVAVIVTTAGIVARTVGAYLRAGPPEPGEGPARPER